MFMYLRQPETEDTAESGFVLILAMVMLLLLSLFGIWALQTSTSELQVAGGSQHVEQQFNITEGAAYSEAGKVGFTLHPFYQISDPSIPFQLLIPLTDTDTGPGDFDPGADTATALNTIATLANGYSGAPVPVATWPWENLLQNYTNLPANTNEFDYRYLTTYLHSDTAPMGYDANTFAGYKFRVQGAAALLPLIVELGGTKIGPK
jgi:hypothetical protein